MRAEISCPSRGLSLAAACVALVLIAHPGAARGDRVDDLTKALLQDSSYKVRVQAALVLGKLKDRRAVTALTEALRRDDNATVRGTAAASLGLIGDPTAGDALLGATNDADGFVQGQAKKALAMLGSGQGGSTTLSLTPKAGARFYMAIGFQSGGKAGPEASAMVREALAKELQKLPGVTLAVGGGGGDPSAAVLASKKLQGFMVDGTMKLTASMAGGGVQIDCDLKAFVATYPGKSVKSMMQAGASLQASASERESGKRDCLAAAAESLREDIGKYLNTVQ